MKSTLEADSTKPLLPTTSCRHQWLLWLRRHEWLLWLRHHLAHPTLKTYLSVTLIFGLVTGLLAAFYEVCFQLALQLVWGIKGEVPHGWFENWLYDLPTASTSLGSPLLRRLGNRLGGDVDDTGFLYILFMSTLFGTMAGMIQRYMGFPGDLPNTVGHVHKMETVPIRQLPSMFLCSLCTIVSGGSLGPEAPLLAMCASTTGWISEKILGHKGQLLRDCTLIGMASGLAAFFGVGLGGAVFAFEVLHRTGLQFFESITFGVSSGMITLLVFRGILGLKFGSIWEFEEIAKEIELDHFVAATVVGIVVAVVAIAFTKMHKVVNKLLLSIGLQEHRTPIRSGLLGGFLIGLIGIFLPPTMFWSEFEISNMTNTEHELSHIWPQSGVWGTGPFNDGTYEGWLFLVIGMFKLLAISITVLSGLRGGFIFPLMFAGASFGRAVMKLSHVPLLGNQSIALMTMAGASGLNTSITRTPFASTLILTSLSGRLDVLPPILCASLVSFFITMPFDFIKTQQYRSDILSVDAVMGRSVVMHQGRNYHPIIEADQQETSSQTLTFTDTPIHQDPSGSETPSNHQHSESETFPIVKTAVLDAMHPTETILV